MCDKALGAGQALLEALAKGSDWHWVVIVFPHGEVDHVQVARVQLREESLSSSSLKQLPTMHSRSLLMSSARWHSRTSSFCKCDFTIHCHANPASFFLCYSLSSSTLDKLIH